MEYRRHLRMPFASGRRVALSIAVTSMALSACGGGNGLSTSSAAATPTPVATPSPSATPLPPAGGRITSAGTVQLVASVAAASVTCAFPSLQGPEIMVAVTTTNGSAGGYLTLTSSEVQVRLGAGSGSTYTQRNFAGPGVTNFDATTGAQFSAQLTDVSPAGQKTGTIGALTSVAGSVSCGDKTTGSGSITITGTSTGGAITGVLTSLLVKCPTGQTFAIINGLTAVASAPATVEIGGTSGNYFASLSTASTNYFFSSSAPALYTLGSGQVKWNNAVLTQTGTGGAGHTVTISGNATCGT
jgi:hypothetical protein